MNAFTYAKSMCRPIPGTRVLVRGLTIVAVLLLAACNTQDMRYDGIFPSSNSGGFQAVSADPGPGVTGVPVGTSVAVTFNQNVDPTSVDASTLYVTGPGGTTLSGGYSVNGTTVTFTPDQSLQGSSTYTVSLTSGIQSVSGASNQTVTQYSFSTGSAVTVDNTPPSLQSTQPAQGDTGVAVNSAFSGTFSEALSPATVNTNTVTLTRQSDLSAIRGSVGLSSDGKTVTFTPNQALDLSTAYTATFTTGIQDTAGNAMASTRNVSFTTGNTLDQVVPTVTSILPDLTSSLALDQAIQVTFDKPLDPSSITSNTVHLMIGGNLVDVSLGWDASTDTLTITPTSLLPGTSTGTLSLNGLKDLAGNPLATLTKAVSTGSSVLNLPDIGSLQPLALLAQGSQVTCQAAGQLPIVGTLVDPCQIFGDVALPGSVLNVVDPSGNVLGSTVGSLLQLLGLNFLQGSIVPDPSALQSTARQLSDRIAGLTCTSHSLDVSQPVTPGVYCLNGVSLDINTPLVLDAQNNPNAKFIFDIANGGLNVLNNIQLINGAVPDNVFFRVDGDITIDALTQGNILAVNAGGNALTVTVKDGSDLHGRLLVLGGQAVQLLGASEIGLP